MAKAIITYYGHSCFKIKVGDSSIVFDPYKNGSVPGLTLPSGIQADVVSCSHLHADHNAAELITVTGKKPTFKVSKIAVPHDHHSGQHRGWSHITFVVLHDLVFCHLGDLGRLPTENEYAAMAKADVVFIPCAGYYTIDSKEAAEIIKHLKHPSLKVLMHFREGKRGYNVQEDIEEVMKDVKGVKRLDQSELTIESGNIPDEIVTLNPIQK